MIHELYHYMFFEGMLLFPVFCHKVVPDQLCVHDFSVRLLVDLMLCKSRHDFFEFFFLFGLWISVSVERKFGGISVTILSTEGFDKQQGHNCPYVNMQVSVAHLSLEILYRDLLTPR